ncbi:hypothetical protein BMAGN_0880 [Bifidobacterium magnum]|uniref:Uncharacterized protein n=2 Tax=Bifidobacterium magnum TaxID=1692 RepID=A0A087BA39_9BIFI|nr:hypothetical protein BMAGN_0880 [Bifidobacterium magnum]
MRKSITPYLRGVAVSVVAMLLFTVPVGLMLSLALLVITMEEGAASLTGFSVPLTKAMTLAAQGVGFHANGVVMGVTPLLLTILLIVLIRAVALKFKATMRSYAGGLVAWLLLDLVMTAGLSVTVNDSWWLVLVKGAVVFSIGCLWAVWPGSSACRRVQSYIHEHVSLPVHHAVVSGLVVGVALLGIYLAIGLVTVIVWTIMNHDAMGTMFTLLQVRTWSRFFICIMSLAWLPNLAIWAMAWLFGASFSIGSIATFTLWNGSATGLPALPVFALFPQAVESSGLRTFYVLIPCIVSVLVGIVALTYRRAFPMWRVARNTAQSLQQRLLAFAYPAGALCIAVVLVSLAASIIFVLADGSLGTHRLRTVGAPVAQSTQALAKPTAIGLFAVWMVALVAVALAYAIRGAASRHHSEQVSESVHEDHASERDASKDHDEQKSSAKVRTAQSSGALHVNSESPNDTPHAPSASHRVVRSASHAKENQNDHEPTTTTGFGIGIS